MRSKTWPNRLALTAVGRAVRAAPDGARSRRQEQHPLERRRRRGVRHPGADVTTDTSPSGVTDDSAVRAEDAMAVDDQAASPAATTTPDPQDATRPKGPAEPAGRWRYRWNQHQPG